MASMRAKMRINRIEKQGENYETLHLNAVARNSGYPEDGSDENNTFSKFTPVATLSISITNPALIGKFAEGEEYYLDFTKAE